MTLINAAFPVRVRRVLEHALTTASDELERHLTAMLDEYEQQLFRLADHARNPGVESSHMQTLRTIRLNRADLLPQFMAGLETSLAGLSRPATPPTPASQRPSFQGLRLIDDTEMDEDVVLREIAVRQESRANLTLHLLGQRFGVLAGAPAFDADRLPLGPQSLCRIMRQATGSLQITLEARLLLYRVFERRVMEHYPQLIETVNLVIANEGILPGLTYVPIRARPATAAQLDAAAGVAPAARDAPVRRAGGAGRGAQGDGGGKAGGRRRGAGPGARRTDPQRPHTAWMGENDPDADAAVEAASFNMLQQLLSSRRELIGKLRPDAVGAVRQQLSTREVVDALGNLEVSATPSGRAPYSLLEIKQSLLAQMRQQRGHGAALSREDNDTFELLDMLYAQIEREVRRDAPAASLLRRLQRPLLQVALQDRGFFARTQHPARELLNAVAESGARWLDQQDLDPYLLAPMQQAVNHVVENYTGDAAVFEASNRELQRQLQHITRKAEMSERRHVEASRGKEKLEIAKQRAAQTITELIGEQRLPRFTRALLTQAWADVLTLTLLRQGAESEDWRQQLDMTGQIIASCNRAGSAQADPALATHIQAALAQVGYHEEEASAIARRLTSTLGDDEDDPASRTELTLKLKARTRLGEDAQKQRRPKLPPRTPEEQARYDQLRVIPFGTWIEFVTNQQGDVVRRRLSWYSTITDHALFVNQRGQRVDEQTLDSVARMLARDQARIVTVERGRIVDRAWQGTLNALRSFAGGGKRAEPEPAA